MNNNDLVTMQCYVENPWALAFMCMALYTHHPSKHNWGPTRPPHCHGSPPLQDYAPWHTTKTAPECLDKSQRCWLGLQIPEIWSASLGRVGTSLIHAPPQTFWTQTINNKPLNAKHHKTPPEVLWPCLDRSELFWLRKENLHNIRWKLSLK